VTDERVFRDKDGDLWAQVQQTPNGQRWLVSLDRKILERVADKFGSYDAAEIEFNYGPLAELAPPAAGTDRAAEADEPEGRRRRRYPAQDVPLPE